MQEESVNRLESIRATKPGMIRAASKALAEGRIDPERFGLSREQVANALEARRPGLESMVVNANPIGLEAIVRVTGRPPLLVQNNAVVLEPLEERHASRAFGVRSPEGRFLGRHQEKRPLDR